MAYELIKLGSLHVNNIPQNIAENPVWGGDIPSYDGCSFFGIRDAVPGKEIQWIKAENSNLLISDRVLLTGLSWTTIALMGFVDGNTVILEDRRYRCRLMKCGHRKGVPNEWDTLIDAVGMSDGLLHWQDICFWGKESPNMHCPNIHEGKRVIRGFEYARQWDEAEACNSFPFVGFRPVLEPMLAPCMK